jgi:hypothetical protein
MIGGNDSEIGSQSAPPVVGTGCSTGVQRQLNNTPNARQYTEAEKGKNKVSDDSSSTPSCTLQAKN